MLEREESELIKKLEKEKREGETKFIEKAEKKPESSKIKPTGLAPEKLEKDIKRMEDIIEN